MKVRKQGDSLVVATKGQNHSWEYVPKIKNPFTDPHTAFPRPHELTGNYKLESREQI